MTLTVVGSATREVVIGDDRPFVIIGERINPTGRKLLAEEMKAGDFSRVERDTIAQVEAGAHMLDVNAGIPLADEPAILAQTIQLVQSLTDLPLSIDSSIVEALEAGLAVYQGKALVNSVTGEDERLERVLPLVKKYGAAVVAISNDETGISEDPDVRFAVAKRIVERALDHGIPREDVVVDPLLMPIGAMPTAGRQVFRILGRLRDELERQLDLRRQQRQLRAAEPRGDQRRVPRDGDRVRPDVARSRTRSPRASGRRSWPPTSSRATTRMPSRWIRQFRVAPPEGEAGGRRVNRRRQGATPPPRPPSGSPGPRPSRPPAADDRREPARGQRSARHLHAVGAARAVRGGDDGPRRGPASSASTSIRSAAGAGSAAAARSSRASASSPSTGSPPRRTT